MLNDLSATYGASRAVLVAVSSYQDSAIPDVPAAINSLTAFKRVLTDTELCGWPEERVTVIENAHNAVKLIQTLRRIAEDTEDTLLIYFVGHGVTDEHGHLCLVLQDTDAMDPDLTGLEYRHLRHLIMSSPAQVSLVILDCCFAGRAIYGLSAQANHLGNIADIKGAYILTAAEHTAHVVPLSEQIDRCTSFSGALVDLIREGLPGGPEVLSLADLYPRLKQRLRQQNLPDPNQRGSDTANHHVFTRNAAFTAQRTHATGDRPLLAVSPDGTIQFDVLALGREIGQALNDRQPVGLTEENIDALREESGIYQLYRWNDNSDNELLYIGSAERSLPLRLRRNLRKLSGRQNINAECILFSHVYASPELAALAPSTFFSSRQRDGRLPPWNLNGFGNADPGRGRDRAAYRPDHFDTLHSIDLEFQLDLTGARWSSLTNALQAIKKQLPYTFRYETHADELSKIKVHFPRDKMSVDEAFRLIAASVGEKWQITALPGYVIMYREGNTQYPGSIASYNGSHRFRGS